MKQALFIGAAIFLIAGATEARVVGASTNGEHTLVYVQQLAQSDAATAGDTDVMASAPRQAEDGDVFVNVPYPPKLNMDDVTAE